MTAEVQSREDYINILPGTRASDKDRDSIIGHLNRAHVEGRMDTETHARRAEIALRATTQAELAGLVRDVPVKTDNPRFKRIEAVRKERPFVFHAVCLVLSVIVGAVPSTLAYAILSGKWQPVVMVPFILLGIVGGMLTIGSAIALDF